MARSKTKNKAENSKDGRKKRLTRKNNNQPSWDDSQDLNAQLRRLNLCTKDIAGDGNCLFRSLSDQYYGNDSQHKSIRQEICKFLEDHEEEYKYFVEDDVPFDKHVSDMKRNGTFGGNMELAAFAKLKKIDIKIYQPGLIYIINGTDTQEDDEENEEKQILHIAYHSWEHYSSIRNINGPSTGPPQIRATQQEGYEDSVENEDNNDNNTKKEDPVDIEKDSKEKAVLSACPTISPRRIKRLLIKHKGDVDKVINLLYEEIYKAEENTTSNTITEGDSSNTDKPVESTTTEPTEPIELSRTTTEPIKTVDQKTSKKNTESVEKLEEGVNETSNVDAIEKKVHNESLDDPNKNTKSDNTTIKSSKEKEDKATENTNKEEEEEEEEKEERTGEDKDEDEEEKEKDDDKEKNKEEMKKTKKPTARQRKLEAKKRQKELQEAKKKAKAERRTKRAQEKISDDANDDTETVSVTTKHLSSSMKELHI